MGKEKNKTTQEVQKWLKKITKDYNPRELEIFFSHPGDVISGVTITPGMIELSQAGLQMQSITILSKLLVDPYIREFSLSTSVRDKDICVISQGEVQLSNLRKGTILKKLVDKLSDPVAGKLTLLIIFPREKQVRLACNIRVLKDKYLQLAALSTKGFSFSIGLPDKLECPKCQQDVDVDVSINFNDCLISIIGAHCRNCKKDYDYQDGKLTKKSGCFIASTVYGEISPEVQILRVFRDQVLLRSNIGKMLVAFYYWLSPPLGRMIAKYRFLKSFFFLSLNPLVKRLRSHFFSRNNL